MIRMVPTTPLTPEYDPWEPLTFNQPPEYQLTSVEFTVTNLCNLRCEHCAVGDTLALKDGEALPLELIFARLDEVDTLRTLSITGGEPMYSERTVTKLIQPLLEYAVKRGLRTQINSNLTLPYSRYEPLLPYLDVVHMSWNYTNVEQFHQIVFAKTGRTVSLAQADKLYQTMIDNAKRLAAEGVFVSAESMINIRTWKSLGQIHRLIRDMGCLRHEIHPMYPSDFARDMELLSLEQIRQAIHSLLDERDEQLWMLFGTLPFFACSPEKEDRELIQRLRNAKNVTVRNDPDGRNRLNVNLFSGDVTVTDFGDGKALGNVTQDRLADVFQRWLEHPVNQKINCYCPAARCAGPNLLVYDSYYSTVNFKQRQALV